MIDEILSPQEVRARLARSYLDSYRRAGIAHTEREIDALAASDCEMVDAARRHGEISNGPANPISMPARAPDISPSGPVLDALSETGTRLQPDVQPLRFNFLHGNPQRVAEQWGYATARINRILEGCARSTSLGEVATSSEYPKLAKEYAELFAYFTMRDRPAPATGIDHNPFRGLSDKDAARMFMRRVYDICDRSTGVLGSWWVK